MPVIIEEQLAAPAGIKRKGNYAIMGAPGKKSHIRHFGNGCISGVVVCQGSIINDVPEGGCHIWGFADKIQNFINKRIVNFVMDHITHPFLQGLYHGSRQTGNQKGAHEHSRTNVVRGLGKGTEKTRVK